jgi:TrmH family RNA methyltransferase
MKEIRSRDNPAVKQLHALASSAQARRRQGLTLLDGPHLIAAALDAGLELAEVVVSQTGLGRPEISALLARCAALPVSLLTDVLFAHASPVDTPSGMLAVLPLPEAPGPARLAGADVVVLDGVQDAGNVGAVLRCAAAAGVSDVLLTEGCAQAWSPRVLRAAMGAHFHLRIFERADLAAQLGGYTGQILATTLGPASTSVFERELSAPTAWLFGAEGQGLSAAADALACARVFIPMTAAVESLNVAAAAAVCLFEQRRQRLAATPAG